VQTTVVVPFSPGDSSERIKQVAELIDLYNQTFELCRKQRIEGPYTEAERTCKRSISLAEQFEPARRLERMSTFRETGHVLFLEGKYAEALESYQKELSIGESFLTDVNAELAAAQHDVGNALWGDRPS
jgi:tetratricopeptide (TPR) repeat protein